MRACERVLHLVSSRVPQRSSQGCCCRIRRYRCWLGAEAWLLSVERLRRASEAVKSPRIEHRPCPHYGSSRSGAPEGRCRPSAGGSSLPTGALRLTSLLRGARRGGEHPVHRCDALGDLRDGALGVAAITTEMIKPLERYAPPVAQPHDCTGTRQAHDVVGSNDVDPSICAHRYVVLPLASSRTPAASTSNRERMNARKSRKPEPMYPATIMPMPITTARPSFSSRRLVSASINGQATRAAPVSTPSTATTPLTTSADRQRENARSVVSILLVHVATWAWRASHAVGPPPAHVPS